MPCLFEMEATDELVTIKGVMWVMFRVMVKGIVGLRGMLMFQADTGTEGHSALGAVLLFVCIISSVPKALTRTEYQEEGTVDDTVPPRGSA